MTFGSYVLDPQSPNLEFGTGCVFKRDAVQTGFKSGNPFSMDSLVDPLQPGCSCDEPKSGL